MFGFQGGESGARKRLHLWLGRHVPDLQSSHWDRGHFVSRCTYCGQSMIKLPGLTWQLRTAAA